MRLLPKIPMPQRVVQGWQRLMARRQTRVDTSKVPWEFPLEKSGFYYHGTTMRDLALVVRGGGMLSPKVTQFSMRPRDAVDYGYQRRNMFHIERSIETPLVLLQFSVDMLHGCVSHKVYDPAIAAALAIGIPPAHAAYVEAIQPIPLSWMTDASKRGIMSWIERQQAELNAPDDSPEAIHWRDTHTQFTRQLDPDLATIAMNT